MHVTCIWLSYQIKEKRGSMTDITQDLLYRLYMHCKLCISAHNIQKHAK